jgi:5-methylcytosine-specific restriction endonuclease McrA
MSQNKGQFKKGGKPWNYAKIKKLCFVCNIIILVPPARYSRTKTCSRKCAGIYRVSTYHHTPETKNKISIALKGRIPSNIDQISGWNKGTKGIMKQNKTSFRRGQIPWCYVGLTKLCEVCSAEYPIKPSIYYRRRTCSRQCGGVLASKERGGENSVHWRGGVTPINSRIRNSLEYKKWRLSVFERDNYTCVHCGDSRGGNLQADHIKPFAIYPEFRFDLGNGRTLCKPCHQSTPSWGYGTRKIAKDIV